MYIYNPSPAEQALLWLIAHRESGGNPVAANPLSSATGEYQDIKTTWQMLCNLAGYSIAQYPTAASAPESVQSVCNLILLRLYGPNASQSWKDSGPYPTFSEVKGMLIAAGIINP